MTKQATSDWDERFQHAYRSYFWTRAAHQAPSTSGGKLQIHRDATTLAHVFSEKYDSIGAFVQDKQAELHQKWPGKKLSLCSAFNSKPLADQIVAVIEACSRIRIELSDNKKLNNLAEKNARKNRRSPRGLGIA